ncbi:MAG TPA: choice-of-anchor V domain-containing protein [Thermoanaerobaculia bacterium]|nr:choice-of-anchor V domain-containing protein [Thermoanaerobaculia bacterium]
MNPQVGPLRTGPEPTALRAWGRASAGALLAVLAGIGLPWSPARPAAANSDGPLPGFTGGFGEPTCHACHFDAPEKPASGELLLSGVPGAFRPGARYAVTVTLRDRRLRRAGFQLTARFEGSGGDGGTAGRQAGRLLVPGGGSEDGPRVEVVEHRKPPVLYARQTRAGSAPAAPHEAVWTVTWIAPEEPAGPVVFHAAANAANDDDSEFGDVIHRATVRSRPAAKP